MDASEPIKDSKTPAFHESVECPPFLEGEDTAGPKYRCRFVVDLATRLQQCEIDACGFVRVESTQSPWPTLFMSVVVHQTACRVLMLLCRLLFGTRRGADGVPEGRGREDSVVVAGNMDEMVAEYCNPYLVSDLAW